MLRYLLRRAVSIVPLMIGISFVSFAVMHLAPGEPTDIRTDLNPKISAESIKRLREMYNLDKPMHVQYLLWLERMAKLDFGKSFSPDARPVIDKITERLPVTILINVIAMVFIFAAAVPIGVYSAVKPYSVFDHAVTVIVFLAFAMPSFWLALILMMWLGLDLRWLPISGLRSIDYEFMTPWQQTLDYAAHLVMPVFVSAIGGLAGLSRYTRQNMLEVIRQDYITTARAKGLDEQTVIYKHALRNALLPVITILGLSVPGLIGGSVIIETIFAIPGMGQLFYQSVMARDYPLVMGVLVIGSFLTLAGNIMADAAYGLADPRIRKQ